MKKLILLCVALAFANLQYAQWGYGKLKDIEKVEERKLIVMLEEVREDMLIKSKDEEVLKKFRADYADFVQSYNTSLKALVEQHWKFKNKGILFKTREQIETLKKKRDKKYAVLYCALRRPVGTSSTPWLNHHIHFMGRKANESRNHGSFYTEMRISLIEKFGKDSPVSLVTLANPLPEKCDLAFGMGSIQQYLNMRKDNPKAKMKDFQAGLADRKQQLKDKTLLLRKDWMAEDFDEEQLKSAYPYAFEVVSAEEFNQRVASTDADADYAYVMIVPNVIQSGGIINKRVLYMHMIVDSANGQMLNMVGKIPKFGIGPFLVKSGEWVGKYYTKAVSNYL